MPPLPSYHSTAASRLATAAACRAADAACQASGTPLVTLMQHAGHAVARAVRRHTAPCRVLVLCGPGNNGGDGFAAACRLRDQGWPVRCVHVLPHQAALSAAASAAATWAARWTRAGGMTQAWDIGLLSATDLVLDGVFGTGLSRPVPPEIAEVFRCIEAAGLPVIAIDLPSGLASDSGMILGSALPATATVTFGWQKPAHLLLPGKRLCGVVTVADIGLGADLPETGEPHLWQNTPALWRHALPQPTAETHKYTRGHVAVLGGATAAGAARLAAMAAARMGSGLVTLLFPAQSRCLYGGGPHSIVLHPFASPDAAATCLADSRIRAAVLGPGAGVTAETQRLVLDMLRQRIPIVLDADALSVFADTPNRLFAAIHDQGVILTPHAAEFRRLFPALGGSKIEQTRTAAVTSGAIVVLKGHDTTLATPDGQSVVINTDAPAWLATGGSGDVLAGMIGGLLAQGMSAWESACAAVWLHGAAARRWGPGMLADDLVVALGSAPFPP